MTSESSQTVEMSAADQQALETAVISDTDQRPMYSDIGHRSEPLVQ